jgi:hypothetical protein
MVPTVAATNTVAPGHPFDVAQIMSSHRLVRSLNSTQFNREMVNELSALRSSLAFHERATDASEREGTTAGSFAVGPRVSSCTMHSFDKLSKLKLLHYRGEPERTSFYNAPLIYIRARIYIARFSKVGSTKMTISLRDFLCSNFQRISMTHHALVFFLQYVLVYSARANICDLAVPGNVEFIGKMTALRTGCWQSTGCKNGCDQ